MSPKTILQQKNGRTDYLLLNVGSAAEQPLKTNWDNVETILRKWFGRASLTAAVEAPRICGVNGGGCCSSSHMRLKYYLAPTFPQLCPRAVYPLSLYTVGHGNAQETARATAFIWDMHVFITQLIEYEISSQNYLYLDRNFGLLFFHLVAGHEVEQNMCKYNP